MGAAGKGFAECHHKVPLSELTTVTKTRLSDLAIVCANCHRMLHRSGPVLSVTELKDVLKASDPYRLSGGGSSNGSPFLRASS